jgi:hypothetical protein
MNNLSEQLSFGDLDKVSLTGSRTSLRLFYVVTALITGSDNVWSTMSRSVIATATCSAVAGPVDTVMMRITTRRPIIRQALQRSAFEASSRWTDCLKS